MQVSPTRWSRARWSRARSTGAASSGEAGDRGRRPHRFRLRRPRARTLLVALVLVVLVLPVPWLHVVSDDPIGHAWRLDGRLYVEGEPVEAPGRWSWLAVGRPPLVAELLWDRVAGTDDPPTDMRRGPRTTSPSLSEPAAVAVGLRHAGIDVPMRLMVEASQPLYEGLPDRVVVTEIAGVELTTRDDWESVVGGWEVPTGAAAATPQEPGNRRASVEPGVVEFQTRSGRSFATPGPGLPYARIDTLDLAPIGLEAAIAGPLTRLAPVSWFRDLSLGSSHGMMVALLTYANASGVDLAQTRHVAGTGGIQGDGTVTRIGGLASKARAARRSGADVLLFPASQAAELASFDPGGMALLPVSSLQEAIDRLATPMA